MTPYLFFGPESAFLEDVGRGFAQKLFCEVPKGPCGVCTRCKQVAQGDSVDSYSYFPDPRYTVAFVRELIDRVQFGPAVFSTLLVRIHYPEQLTPEAANALLKLVEEPPTGVCFAFLSYAKNKLPLTLVSRCQAVFSPPYSQQDISGKFAEKFGVAPNAFYSQHLGAQLVAIRSSAILPEALQRPIEEVATLSITDKLQLAEQYSAHKIHVPDLLTIWLDFCWAQLKHEPNSGPILTRANLLIEKLKELQYNVNLKLLLDALFLQL